MNFTEHAPCLREYTSVYASGDFLHLVEDECKQDWGYLSWYQTPIGANKNNVQNAVDIHRTSLGCEMGPLHVPVESVSQERLIPLVKKWAIIRERIDKCIWHYRNTYSLSLSADEGFRLLKYGRGAEYKGHVDHAPTNGRVLSLVSFVNDGFSGGELVFPLLDVTIKPVEGSVLLFPSNFPYYHYAAPVGKNDETIKYSLVTWLQ